MSEITWADTGIAKVGDVIVDGERRVYVIDMHERTRSDDNFLKPERRLEVREYQWNAWHYDGHGIYWPATDKGVILSRQEQFAEYSDKKDYTMQLDTHEWTIKEPAVIKCQGSVEYWNDAHTDVIYKPCESEVILDMVMTNTCDKCHTDYNLSGQRLAPRSQWGWDTGESLGDILSANWAINDPYAGMEVIDD